MTSLRLEATTLNWKKIDVTYRMELKHTKKEFLLTTYLLRAPACRKVDFVAYEHFLMYHLLLIKKLKETAVCR